MRDFRDKEIRILEYLRDNRGRWLSAPEIARALDMPESTVRSILNRLHSEGLVVIKEGFPRLYQYRSSHPKQSSLDIFVQSGVAGTQISRLSGTHFRVSSPSTTSSEESVTARAIDHLISVVNNDINYLMALQRRAVSTASIEVILNEISRDMIRAARLLEKVRDKLRHVLLRIDIDTVNEIIRDIILSREKMKKIRRQLKESDYYVDIENLAEDRERLPIDKYTIAKDPDNGSSFIIKINERDISDALNRIRNNEIVFIGSDDASAPVGIRIAPFSRINIYYDALFEIYGASANVVLHNTEVHGIIEPRDIGNIKSRIIPPKHVIRGLTKVKREYLQKVLEDEEISHALSNYRDKKIIVLHDGVLHPTELHPADFYYSEKADVIKRLIERTMRFNNDVVKHRLFDAFGIVKRVNKPVFSALLAEIMISELNIEEEKAYRILDLPESLIMSVLLEKNERTIVISRVPLGGLLTAGIDISKPAKAILRKKLGLDFEEYIELMTCWRYGMLYLKRFDGVLLPRIDFFVGKEFGLIRKPDNILEGISILTAYAQVGEFRDIGIMQNYLPIIYCHEKASNFITDLAKIIMNRFGS